ISGFNSGTPSEEFARFSLKTWAGNHATFANSQARSTLKIRLPKQGPPPLCGRPRMEAWNGRNFMNGATPLSPCKFSRRRNFGGEDNSPCPGQTANDDEGTQ